MSRPEPTPRFTQTYRLAWAVLTVLYLAIRFQNAPGVLTDDGVILRDTDPYYRLHRIERIVQTGQAYPLHDPDLSFPDGFDVPWPTGLDHAIALPLRFMGARSRTAIATVAAAAIPFLSVPTLWLSGFLAHQLAGRVAALAAGFFLAVSAPHRGGSEIGMVDHHLLESLFTVLGLVLLLIPKSLPRSLALGLLLGAAPLFWPTAWILGFFVGAFLLTRPAESFAGGLVFLLGAAISVLGLLFSDRFLDGTVTPFGFSWWTPFVCGSGVIVLTARALAAGRDGRGGLERIVFGGGLLFFALLLFHAGPAGFPQAVRSGWEALFPKASLGAITYETRTLFTIPPLQWATDGLLIFGMAWIWLARSFRRPERRSVWAYAIVPLLLALLQRRLVVLASPVYCALAGALVADFGRAAARRGRNGWLASLALAVLVAVPALPRPGWTAFENRSPFFRPILEAADFLGKVAADEGGDRRAHAIAAPWNYGHWLLYRADLPVIAHPFQDVGGPEIYRMFLSRDPGALRQLTARRQMRYLLAEAPTHRVDLWRKALGEPPGGPLTGTWLARLMEENGAGPASLPDWRLRFVSRYPAPEGGTGPALKVFERVPGLVFAGRARSGRELSIVAEVGSSTGPFLFRRTSKAEGGEILWSVPYAAVNEGGVRFDGRYRIEEKGKTVLRLAKPVREDEVLSGAVRDLGSIP